MRKAFKLLRFILLQSAVISLLLYIRSTPWSTDISSNLISFPQSSTMRMVIINTVYYHGETWYSYLYAAAIRCHWQVSLFTVATMSRIQREAGLSFVTRSWSRSLLSTPQQHINQLLIDNATICAHQIIAICTLDEVPLSEILRVLLDRCEKRTPYLVLLQLHQGRKDIHRVENVLKGIPDFRLQKRVELRYMVFAEHVKSFAELNMEIPISVDIWRPFFPLDLPHFEENDYFRYFDFVVQGRFETNKRDYTGLAAELRRHQSIMKQLNIMFTLVGFAPTLDRLTDLRLPNVRLFLTLDFLSANAFFSVIHDAVGLVPVFVGDKYYVDVQSSTIARSILTQTPLIASRRLLDTHKYIPEEAVWIRDDNETDVEAVLRHIRSFPSKIAFKKALFMKRQRLEALMEESYAKNERTLIDYANMMQQRGNI